MIEYVDGTPAEVLDRLGRQDPEAVLAAARRVLGRIAEEAARVPNGCVDALLSAIGALDVVGGAARVALVAEGLDRGLVGGDATGCPAASPVDWVLERSPGMPPGEARRVVEVARAGGARAHRAVFEAVCGGRVSTAVGAAVLAEFGRLEPQLTDRAAPAVLGGMLQVGAEHGVRAVRELRARVVAEFGPAGMLDREQATLARMRSLATGVDDGSGLREYRMRLDPEAAETLEAALSPLAAPQPSAEGGPDLRGSDQRRADALVEIVTRAVAAADGVPATAKTVLVVTVDHERLRDGLGAGTTPNGTPLAPGVVRRLACEAGILPMVLGSEGEVLDVGRERRLVTPRLLRALWVRDRGCSYPGCTRPPGWCEAHHVRHWANGGGTDLGNLALLCRRHHSHVHARGLTATVGPAGVTWHTGVARSRSHGPPGPEAPGHEPT